MNAYINELFSYAIASIDLRYSLMSEKIDVGKGDRLSRDIFRIQMIKLLAGTGP